MKKARDTDGSEPSFDYFITNIKGLVQVREQLMGPLRGREMDLLPVIENAFLAIADGKIADYGPMTEIYAAKSAHFIDATGKFVFPSFVDSHTHLVYPSSREDEFVMKIKGATYGEIAAGGGGILNSARRVAETSEEDLFNSAIQRLKEITFTGTGAVEIKSGYGLSTQSELKLLRVAKRLREASPLKIKTTFLGAHAVPRDRSKEDYIREIVDDMIPAVAQERLADYIDAFCEDGFFTPQETEYILRAGMKYGMKPRLHANQLARSGGVQVGVRVNALSVDHLENIGDEEIEALSNSSVIPTTLPGAAFFLNLPMPPARKMLDANLPLAIASDYNPGSSPSGNMPLMISLACIRMKITPAEAINAATINTACALELQHEVGSITRGKSANFFITTPMPSIAYLPYSFGSRLVDRIFINGQEIYPA